MTPQTPAGLTPYGIVMEALEEILELDVDEGSFDDARAIASLAHSRAIAHWNRPVEPKPLRELAAALAETRDVRDGYARLCEEFGDHSQSGQSARISLTVLNRHRQAAGLPARQRPPAGERPRDPYMKLLEQRDELHAMLSALIDRTEGGSVLTDDERAEYRRRLEEQR